MPRNGLAVVDWAVVGPRALAWLEKELPQRTSLRGIMDDCVAALGVPGLQSHRLIDWLGHGKARPVWQRLKQTLKTPASPVAPKSLVEFMKDKKRAACQICSLDAEVRAQLAKAGEQGIKVADQVDWLIHEVGVAVTRADLDSHRSQRHEA